VCLTLGDARNQIATDGFSVGVVLPAGAPDTAFVDNQDPVGGGVAPVGSAINLGVVDTLPSTCP